MQASSIQLFEGFTADHSSSGYNLELVNSVHLSRAFHHFVHNLYNRKTNNNSTEEKIPINPFSIKSILCSPPFPPQNDEFSPNTEQTNELSEPSSPVLAPPLSPALFEEKKAFRCYWQNCGEVFSTRTGLATHCSEHLEDIFNHIVNCNRNKRQKVIIRCKWINCQEAFTGIKNLAKHLAEETHIGQTPFVPKRDVELDDETQEVLLQDDPKFSPIKKGDSPKRKRYFCTISGCGKSFTDSSNRKKHERTHDKNRERFYCTEVGCCKSYSTKTDLNIHVKVHRGEYPHKCTHTNCAKAFVRLSELYAHERTHDNILPHICNVCGKRFREKSRLRKHEEAHAENNAEMMISAMQLFRQSPNASNEVAVPMALYQLANSNPVLLTR